MLLPAMLAREALTLAMILSSMGLSPLASSASITSKVTVGEALAWLPVGKGGITLVKSATCPLYALASTVLVARSCSCTTCLSTKLANLSPYVSPRKDSVALWSSPLLALAP